MRRLQRFVLIVCALSCPALAWAQGGVPASPIYFSGPTGRPLAGATVTFCTSAGVGFPCSPLASIFTNAGLSIASPNPVTTDGNGNIPVIFAAPGVYILSVTGSGITPTLVTATVAGSGGGNVVLSANNNFTGIDNFKNLENIRFADQFASVQLAINDLPVSGGVVMIPPGSYAGPTSIPNNNITLRCTAFLACTFTYTTNVTFGTSGAFLDRLSLDGIIFDFGNNAAGLILHGTRSGYFAIKIQNSTGAGLTQIATSPNNNSTQNDFVFLQMDNVAIGLVLNGDSNLTSCGAAQNAAGAVYLNNYAFVDIENYTGAAGIKFTSGNDSNNFGEVYILSGAANTAGNHVIFGSRCPSTFGDVTLEHFHKLTMDALNPAFVGPFLQANYSSIIADEIECVINCTFTNVYGANATAAAAGNVNWKAAWSVASPYAVLGPFLQTFGLVNTRSHFQTFLTAATAGANFAGGPIHWQSSQWNGAVPVISDWSLTPSFVGSGVPTFENFALSHSGGLGIPYTFLITTPIQLGVQNGSGNNNIFVANSSLAAGNTNVTLPALAGTLVPWVGTIDLTAQTANIGNTTAFSVPATGAGLYRVSIYAVVTSPGTTSSLPTACILWTDKDSNGAPQQIFNVTSSGLTNASNTTATAEYGTIVVNSKASVSIAYNFGTCTGATAYASTGAAMQYAVHIKVEALL